MTDKVRKIAILYFMTVSALITIIFFETYYILVSTHQENVMQNCETSSTTNISDIIEEVTTPTAEPSCNPNDTSQEIEDVSRSERLFSLNFYKQLSKRKNPNLIVPTVLAFINLVKLSYAAANQTKQELVAAIELPDPYCFDHRIGYRNLIDRLKNSSTKDVQFAHNIFISSSTKVKTPIKNLLRDIFSSRISTFKTKGNIMHWFVNNANPYSMLLSRFVAVERISGNENIIPAGVGYIQGTWSNDFVKCQEYILVDGGDIYGKENSTYMQAFGEFNHGIIHNLNATFIEIQLERGVNKNNFSMFIILPHEEQGLRKLEATIDEETLRKHLFNSSRHKMHVILPEMILEYHDDYKESHTEMGLKHMCSEEANLAGFSDDNSTKVDMILYKIVLTGVKNADRLQCMPIVAEQINATDTIKFIANRPFLIVVAINDENPIIIAIARYSKVQTTF